MFSAELTSKKTDQIQQQYRSQGYCKERKPVSATTHNEVYFKNNAF
jgi:hypothetical protein